MSTLLRGMESKAMIDCLISGTKIDSERKIKALHLYFVNGFDIGLAASTSGVPQPNVTGVIGTLNKVASVCERYHELKMHSKAYK